MSVLWKPYSTTKYFHLLRFERENSQILAALRRLSGKYFSWKNIPNLSRPVPGLNTQKGLRDDNEMTKRW